MPKKEKEKPGVAAPTDKHKAAQELIVSIEKAHGAGAVVQPRRTIQHPSISTGIVDVDDYLLGVGGFPKGRIHEVFGSEGSGKTSLAYSTIASAQKTGGMAAFIDVEHGVNPVWATTLGVDMEALLLSQPDSAESALDITESVVRSGAFDIVVLDSVAGLVPQAELEGEYTDANMGLAARLLGKAMRRLAGATNLSGTCVIFINQLRSTMGGGGYGPTETTSGGRALRFFASTRIEVKRIGQVKAGDEVVGHQTRFKCVKNRFGTPYREVLTDLRYGVGWDIEASALDAAVLLGKVEKSGSWFSVAGQRFQGREAAIKALRDNPELYAALLASMKKGAA